MRFPVRKLGDHVRRHHRLGVRLLGLRAAGDIPQVGLVVERRGYLVEGVDYALGQFFAALVGRNDYEVVTADVAEEIFAKPVPAELMSLFVEHKETLAPELRGVWEANGSKASTKGVEVELAGLDLLGEIVNA